MTLTADGMVQRIAADGTILGVSPMPDGEIDMLKAVEGQSRPRGKELFARVGCVLGTTCSDDATCWYNGCDGCLFVSTNIGVCYGTSA